MQGTSKQQRAEYLFREIERLVGKLSHGEAANSPLLRRIGNLFREMQSELRYRTCADFANALGISRTFLSHIMNGKQAPGERTLTALSLLVHCKVGKIDLHQPIPRAHLEALLATNEPTINMLLLLRNVEVALAQPLKTTECLTLLNNRKALFTSEDKD